MTLTPCPDPGRLAAAASDEDAAALAHAARCERCRPLVHELRVTRGELAAMPPPTLSASRRASIEDAVLVAVDAGALAPRRTWPVVAAVAFAAAAAVVVVALASQRSAPSKRTPAPEPRAAAPTVEPIPAPAPVPTPTPAPPAPIIESVGATDHTVDLSTETLALRDGAVVVDTRKSGPLAVTLGNATRVTVTDARVEVRAKKGVLVAVHVFAGSAEVTTGGRRRAEIVAGDVWEPEVRDPKPEAQRPRAGVDEFRTGWLALRAGDHDAAAAAFDRATDPAVAEDAAFWGAVARERAGDTADARARFERFLAAYPSSARADAAREHLAALAP